MEEGGEPARRTQARIASIPLQADLRTHCALPTTQEAQATTTANDEVERGIERDDGVGKLGSCDGRLKRGQSSIVAAIAGKEQNVRFVSHRRLKGWVFPSSALNLCRTDGAAAVPSPISLGKERTSMRIGESDDESGANVRICSSLGLLKVEAEPASIRFALQVMLWLDLDHGLEDYFPEMAINARVMEIRLQKLKERVSVPFDETRPDHQEALVALWHISFPETELTGLVSEQWKDMGWQGPNPSTDFRGCGFVSLENLLFFARTYPASFQRILFKQEGMRAIWEYPFAVAGINISFMLTQLLELNSARPKSLPAINFVKILSEDEEAFDMLYCIAFQLMDAQWLAMDASYMQFKEVLEATRIQLGRELALDDVRRIQDLPAYNLLYK
ncbi:ELMO CED-12 family protein [Musa troglodytarum]|uniref:ELMO CED-12 family protein n=1 Tax=Musa troglodytarum TaxID=320322 RepID=A0A9E7F603_9LILI|nr:ELMO CED-12 family protein [Musa troglodytarum]